jgi:tight adherence protein B
VAAWIPDPLVQMGAAVAEVGGFKGSLDRKLERAGLAMTPGEVVAGMVLLGILGLLAGALIFGNILAGLVVGVVAAWIPSFLLTRRMNKRVNLLHSQLPDVLMILASSMRAGHSFLQALDTVSKEIGEPSAPEFARVVTEIRLGRPFDQALTALAERVGTSEFKWAMLGVNVQREVGGNLAEILDTLAETVREREQVRRQVKVLSAEGRISVKILILMPFVITGYMVWVNPSYMKLLWTTHLGIAMLAVGAILMLVGFFWSRKVVKFDV